MSIKSPECRAPILKISQKAVSIFNEEIFERVGHHRLVSILNEVEKNPMIPNPLT